MFVCLFDICLFVCFCFPKCLRFFEKHDPNKRFFPDKLTDVLFLYVVNESPWWMVDVGSVKCVGKVEIFNRVDCCCEYCYENCGFSSLSLWSRYTVMRSILKNLFQKTFVFNPTNRTRVNRHSWRSEGVGLWVCVCVCNLGKELSCSSLVHPLTNLQIQNNKIQKCKSSLLILFGYENINI